MLEFQAEAFFFHFVVTLWVELIEESYLLVWHWQCLIELGQDTKLQHFIAKVTSVELDTENGLIQMLQLGHRKLLWQQLEAYWLEVNLAAQFIGGLSQD